MFRPIGESLRCNDGDLDNDGSGIGTRIVGLASFHWYQAELASSELGKYCRVKCSSARVRYRHFHIVGAIRVLYEEKAPSIRKPYSTNVDCSASTGPGCDTLNVLSAVTCSGLIHILGR